MLMYSTCVKHDCGSWLLRIPVLMFKQAQWLFNLPHQIVILRQLFLIRNKPSREDARTLVMHLKVNLMKPTWIRHWTKQVWLIQHVIEKTSQPKQRDCFHRVKQHLPTWLLHQRAAALLHPKILFSHLQLPLSRQVRTMMSRAIRETSRALPKLQVLIKWRISLGVIVSHSYQHVEAPTSLVIYKGWSLAVSALKHLSILIVQNIHVHKKMFINNFIIIILSDWLYIKNKVVKHNILYNILIENNYCKATLMQYMKQFSYTSHIIFWT